jgi:hypothetical protein
MVGSVLPDGSDVIAGEEIYFLLFVDNPTATDAWDIQVIDPLDESQFTYITGSLESVVIPSGSDPGTFWAGAWAMLTDALGTPDDEASVMDTGGPPGPNRIAVGTVTGQVNQTADVPANSLLAIRFRVRVN